MKAKIIGCISLAAALGAVAGGTMLLQKPTPINHTVYINTKKNTNNNVNATNEKKVAITIYEQTPVKANPNNAQNQQWSSSVALNHGNSYQWTPIGTATVKTSNLGANASAININKKYYTAKTVEIPENTKLNVLWVMGNAVAIDYNGTEALVPIGELNISSQLSNKKYVMKEVSKNEVQTAHYIGAATVENAVAEPGMPSSALKPSMMVPFNGISYPFDLKAGTKVNVVSKGNAIIKNYGKNENKTFGSTNVTSLQAHSPAIIEYNGLYGYLAQGTLSNFTPTK